MRTDKVIVVILWVVVVKLAAWTVVAAVLGWIEDDTVRILLVALVPFTAGAVTLNVRLFAVRMCSMIRATSSERGGDLHALP